MNIFFLTTTILLTQKLLDTIGAANAKIIIVALLTFFMFRKEFGTIKQQIFYWIIIIGIMIFTTFFICMIPTPH